VTGSRYADYDPFAWLYNEHWGEAFLPTSLAVIEELVLPRIPEGARILDLCCGTGQLANELSKRGYDVAGIDRSGEMLSYARQNAPLAEFIRADARSFAVERAFDAVVCMFDSLNHIPDLDGLQLAFRCVLRALRPGGVFLFDLNLEEGYLANWNGTFGIVEPDHVCVIRNAFEKSAGLALFSATLFRLQGGEWRRSDFDLEERCYSVGEVLGALEEAGFRDVRPHSFSIEDGLSKLGPGAWRGFFACEKSER